MRLEQSFTVTAPVAATWSALADVERIVRCLPGAQINEKGPEGTYEGEFTVELGPATGAYNGVVRIEERDEEGRTAVLSARGTDRLGEGGATAFIRSSVRGEADVVRVALVTELEVTGRLAGVAQGAVVEDVATRLLGEFASCLQATLDAEPQAEPDVEAGVAPPPDVEPPEALSPSAAAAAAAAAAALDPGAGAPPVPPPGAPPIPGPPGAGDAGTLPPIAAPPAPPGGGPPPGPAPLPHAAPTEGTAEGAPTMTGAAGAPMQAPSASAGGGLGERLSTEWKRLGRWLRARLHRSS